MASHVSCGHGLFLLSRDSRAVQMILVCIAHATQVGLRTSALLPNVASTSPSAATMPQCVLGIVHFRAFNMYPRLATFCGVCRGAHILSCSWMHSALCVRLCSLSVYLVCRSNRVYPRHCEAVAHDGSANQHAVNPEDNNKPMVCSGMHLLNA